MRDQIQGFKTVFRQLLLTSVCSQAPDVDHQYRVVENPN